MIGWKPKYGDEYRRIDVQRDGTKSVRQAWYNFPDDLSCWETDNVFQTEEEIQARIEYLKTHKLLKDYAAEHNEGVINWKDHNAKKYYIKLLIDSIFVDSWFNTRMAGQVYFTSEEIAQAAVKEIGEERVKQYLLYEG